MKVVINGRYGGFCISEECAKWMADRGHVEANRLIQVYRDSGEWYGFLKAPRHHPLLVMAVEELGEDAWGMGARLVVHKLSQPLYYIKEYDGYEECVEPACVDWQDAREV